MKKIITLILLSSSVAIAFQQMGFVTIPANTFLMGSADSELGRSVIEDLHVVSISKDFEMQTTAVTQSQWVSLMNSNPSEFKNKINCETDFTQINNIDVCPNHPVENVSFSDVQKYVQLLNETDANYIYKLPTEAQWEMAARANSGAAYYFSDEATDLENYAVLDANSTSAVATKIPNNFGLYDMYGNVSQWVSDYFYYYPQIDFDNISTDPEGTEVSDYRMVRGGDWSGYMYNRYRSAYRNYVEANIVNSSIGFRLTRIKK